MTTYYITKYALTDGILLLSGDDIEITECSSLFKNGSITAKLWGDRRHYYQKRDWHRTEAEAVDRANEMRDAKIKSVEKQLANLRAMTFGAT